tara:strand:+ start:6755 stop:7054 length:300 start_codon:yes stop_codon:yes gene_type:complete
MFNLTELKNIIELLPHYQQLLLVEHLIQHKIQYTENKNGIFLNISMLSNHDISIIQNFIAKTKEETDNFNKVEQIKEEFKKQLEANVSSSLEGTTPIPS